METKITTPVVKGTIITLILIVFGLIIYFVDKMQHPEFGYVQYALFLGGIIWACISYSKQMNSNVSFGNLFAHGFKTTAVVTVLIIIFMLLEFKILFPEMVDKSIEISRKKMEESGKMTDSQIDQQLSAFKDHFTLITVAFSIFGFAILGAISSLIGAAIAKKQPKDPFGNQAI